MAFVPFDNLRKQGYKIDAHRRVDTHSTNYIISKGDFKYNCSADDYIDDPKYYRHLEEHVEHAFKDTAERKIKEMVLMYGVSPGLGGSLSQMQMGQMYNSQDNIARQYAMMNALPPADYGAEDKKRQEKEKVAAEATKKKKIDKKMLVVIKHKQRIA